LSSDNEFIVLGGQDSNFVISNVEKYDTNRTYTKLSSLPLQGIERGMLIAKHIFYKVQNI